MSLYTVVSRGVVGRLSQRPVDATQEAAARPARRTSMVRLPGASMHVLEVGLALGAIATAILIGIGR